MATTDNITGSKSHRLAWPNEPEGLLEFLPPDLDGSPFEMLTCTLVRAQGIIAVLSAELMGNGDYRPSDASMTGAIWAVRGHLSLARELLEHFDTYTIDHSEGVKLRPD